MGVLIVLIIIGTVIWVGFDSSNIVSRGTGEVGGTSTAGWVLVCLLLWIVGFPAYLVQRAKFLSQPTPPQHPSGSWNAIPGPGPGYGMSAPSMQHEPARNVGPWSAPQPPPPHAGAYFGTTPPSAGPAIPQQPSVTEELERLGRLREGGHLTDDEFARLKGKILN